MATENEASPNLVSALEAAKIKISKYDPSKSRPVYSNVGTMDVKKFTSTLLEKLGAKILKFPEIVEAAHEPGAMEELLEKYFTEVEEPDYEITIPSDLTGYTLNVDITAKESKDEFFLTTKDEYKSRMSGRYYIKKCRIPDTQVHDMARAVIPEYRPRSLAGVTVEKNLQTKENENIFNSYVPAEWAVWRKENPAAWRNLPASPPSLVMKLLKHLIPSKEERRYLYAWMYASMTTRAYVFLVLCGAPGAGKNRFKLVLRALHGLINSNDGKRSTITERFNSQLSEGTVTWFDELRYDSDMENVMKEIQNDYISIERKGVDATRSSTIHSSMVISNNKPRDNHIAFDARKFAPLTLASNDLRRSMSDSEIEILSRKVDPKSPDFDKKFVAQIAKWILSVGKSNFANYPNLEYKGPMFWTLAHTSMTRWQKKAISVLVDKNTGIRVGWDSTENAHLWSKVEEKITKRSNDNSMTFPDYSTVKAFFDIFRDGNGVKAFDTKLVPGNNILGDFWIYPLIDQVEIITESTVAQQREKGKRNGPQENYDL